MFLILASTATPAADAQVDDAALGHQLLQDFIREAGIRPSPDTDAIQGYLQKIGDRLSAETPGHSHYTFTYYSSPAFKSAVALPGNNIIVGGGLLAVAETEDEIANALAHEIEHLEMKQVQARTVELEQRKHVAPDKLSVTEYFPHYTKAQELACDRNGALLAQTAGYSPTGMLTLLERFKAMRQGKPETESPDTLTLDERLQQLRAMFAHSDLKAGNSQKPIQWP